MLNVVVDPSCHHGAEFHARPLHHIRIVRVQPFWFLAFAAIELVEVAPLAF